MGLRYDAGTGQQSVSVAQDLLECLAPSDATMLVHKMRVDQGSDTDSEQVTVTLSRVTGAPTSGSGGGSATVTPVVPGAPAAGGTYERNNTTQISGGTSAPIGGGTWSFNIANGVYEVFDPPLEIAPGTRVVLASAAPADALSMQAVLTVEEVGG